MKSWDKARDFINKHKHQRKKENIGTACAADTHVLLTWKRYQKFSKATVWLGCRQGLFPPFREKSWPQSCGTLHSWSPFLLCGTFLVSDSFSAIFFYILKIDILYCLYKEEFQNTNLIICRYKRQGYKYKCTSIEKRQQVKFSSFWILKSRESMRHSLSLLLFNAHRAPGREKVLQAEMLVSSLLTPPSLGGVL